jgi:hypothetical protein
MVKQATRLPSEAARIEPQMMHVMVDNQSPNSTYTLRSWLIGTRPIKTNWAEPTAVRVDGTGLPRLSTISEMPRSAFRA